ncbi:hypothetical protein Bhyg_01487 [Pseudolycoriella hygida]|uniref:Uncharacterized protein n=1 Tax=Pseudolycoriella hygida TaxID=35572 RepID=A0A9Q0NB39_9DIPT|nr:hypothetical protein Bhyg_01487 [Pseudolycoriella hygida]
MDSIACDQCKISFIGSDVVLAGTCGHVIHESCLQTPISSSRNYCHSSGMRRIYLPFQHEVTEAERLVKQRKIFQRELKEADEDLSLLRKDEFVTADLHTKMINKNRAMKMRKIEKEVEVRTLNAEKANLLKKVADLEKVLSAQKVLTESARDVEKMITQKMPADSLAAATVILKRETERLEGEKRKIRSDTRQQQKENQVLASKYRNCKEKLEVAIARNKNSK